MTNVALESFRQLLIQGCWNFHALVDLKQTLHVLADSLDFILDGCHLGA